MNSCMADGTALKEGSPEWYKSILDFLSKSTYETIVRRESVNKIEEQLNDAYQLLLNLRSDVNFRRNEPVRKTAMMQSNYLRSLTEYMTGQTGSASRFSYLEVSAV